MRRHFVALCCLCVLSTGCDGTANRPLTQDDEGKIALSNVGELYRLYTAEQHKAPTGIADFAPLARVSPAGLAAIESGAVIVRFGARLTGTEEGPSNDPADEVLAYQKDVPLSGGQVLMSDRTVRTMTPDEFKAAKLAGNKSSEAVSNARKPRS